MKLGAVQVLVPLLLATAIRHHGELLHQAVRVIKDVASLGRSAPA